MNKPAPFVDCRNAQSAVACDEGDTLLNTVTQHYLLSLLHALADVEQSPRYHPEGDALYHSLQVFQYALRETGDPELLAAALFHDVGKAIDYPRHDDVGADAIEDVLSPRTTWLVRRKRQLNYPINRLAHATA